MALEDFDSHKFTIISVPFAVALVVVFIAWLLINQFVFKWRPALLGPVVIAHRIKSMPKSFGTIFLLILYWIFFILPFILFLAWGGIISYYFTPYYFGIIIGLGPTSILLIIYIYFDYHYRGFFTTTLSKIGLAISFLIILIVTVGSVYLLDRQSWIEITYLFAFPPSLFFMISYTYSHSYIPNDVFEYALESQENMDDFVDQLSNHDETCFKGSKKLNIPWSIGNVVFSLVCNFLYQLNYWFKDPKNEKKLRDASFYTAFGFFLIDFLLLLAQAGREIHPSFFIIIFLGYIVKVVTITFTTQYWIAGHGVVYFFLSTFLLVRFIMGFWKPKVVNDLRSSSDDPNVKKLNEIMNKNVKMPFITVIMSFVSWVILASLFIAEIVKQYKNEFAPLPFEMKQIDALIALVVLSVPISLMFCSCFYLYNNCGNMTVATYVMYFLAIAILVLFDVFWKGAKALLLLRLLVPVVFIFLSSCVSFLIILYYQKKDSFKRCSYLAPFLIYFFITIASMVCSIALPYGCQKYFKQVYSTAMKLSGLMIVLGILTILFYSFFLLNILRENSMKNPKTITSFVLSVLFVAGLGVSTGSLYVGIAVFCIVLVVFCIAFAFSYTKHNDWIFSLCSYLVIAIPSFIIFVIAAVAIFKVKNDRLIFFVCIVAFGSAFALFGSTLFYWLQKKNFYFNWVSILSIVCLVVFIIIAIDFIYYKYRKPFTVISIILLCIFIASLLGMLCFVLSQSISNVIVVSNIFFPIRRLVDDRIKNITMFNVLYALTFITCWFWGLFGSIFFDNHPDYGPLASTGAILIIGFITCYFITDFDSYTYSALNYIHKEEIKYAIDTAMSASNINIELVTLDKPDKNDYDAYMEYVDKKIESKRNVSLFLSSLKAELYISSDVAFRSARNQIRHFFHNLDYSDEELEFLTYETGWDNSDRIKIYSLLLDINDNPEYQREEEDYNNKVKKQVEKRMKVNNSSDSNLKPYPKIVSSCERSHEKYEDFYYNNDTDTRIPSCSSPSWKRMEDIYTGKMFDPNRGFNANTIKQGGIGDCYLIAAMVSISKSNETVQKIFSNPINNNAGVRCVNFNIMGKSVPVIVDTTIPFTSQSERALPVGCKPVKPTDQWWATIIEKAYAKYYGSYQSIEGGNSHIALYRLVGGFPLKYDMQEIKTKEMVQNGSIWKMMLKWYQQGDYICAGSKSGSDTKTTPQGINFGHAYTVLRVVDIYGNQLMQLRNPWGRGEWTGDWSDKSGKWTPKMAQVLDLRDEEDGIFWISFDDFINNFRVIYASIRIFNKKKYVLDGIFEPDENDGASPFASGETDALHLTQWVIRANSNSSQPTLNCIFEKSGGSAYSDVVLVYNNGKKLKYLTGGNVFANFGLPATVPLTTFQWDYEEPQKPVNLLIYRKKFAEPTNWHFEIYSNADLEITKLE